MTRVHLSHLRNLSTSTSSLLVPDLVFVDGVRTPFLEILTQFQGVMPHQLLAQAMTGLLSRTGLAASDDDYLCAGQLVQEATTPNVTKEAAFEAGFPDHIPGHTVSMACISAIQAVTSAMALLSTGQAEVALAGGVEVLSDQPIRYPRLVRQMLLKAPRARTAAEHQELGAMMTGFSARSLVPEIPDLREFSTGEVVGHSSDRLCEVWGVTRREQDEYSLRSHARASEASEAGLLSDIIQVRAPGTGEVVTRDNGIRRSSMEQLLKLKPAFRVGKRKLKVRSRSG